ncbi:RagB/SusD family nutrient uptake outer membrane protein [Pedobacter sp. PLR]|uniref:RagB/SusD family nutrient uptake outer membrane protein n=1 Tax=Pedobacter sp. PLR TaxID=2994465 RepID=UPI00224640E4|nr:RagB/SusD family nutrient uptake outer membrane protein [Pedobacter sp. PLR]MCX2452615.1 RagB/SusD family nutrient uptake outer membrane protein [Pedobacter sp. PLR]
MKRILYILIPGLLLINTGCKKFLEEKSQDEMRPSTVQDLNGLMAGEAYPYSVNISSVLNLVTDDISCVGGQGLPTYEAVVRRGKAPFSWSKQMFEELLVAEGLSTVGLNSWEVIYNRIVGCNVGLEYADKVIGNEADKANIKAEVLALRGYYYFLLVNMYGKPYNAAGVDPETSPGVPLKLKMVVTDALFKRNSVAEVYRQIEQDIQASIALFQQYPQDRGVYKMSETAGYALLSRVYLYQEKWDLAIEYANKALAKKSVLTQLSTFNSAQYYLYNGPDGLNLNKIYSPATSKEVIWTYVPNKSLEDDILKTSLSPGYNRVNVPPYGISPELLNLYDSKGFEANEVYIGDLRPRIYFTYATYVGFTAPSTVTYFFRGITGGMGGAGIRVAELYLNRAEANIQKFIQTGNDALRISALNDLNTLRISRYDTRKAYVPIDITDQTQLLNFYKDERRRELPFDGHRWFDLRRYGMPSISHEYLETAGTGQTFTLSKGDSRYTWPIPQVVLDRNGELTQNP